MTMQALRARRRGQASLETIALFAGAMVIILVMMVVLPSSAQAGEVLRQNQIARQTVQDVTRTADEVYLAGEGASKTIWVEIPPNWVANRSFVGNRSAAPWTNRTMINLYLEPVGDLFGISRAPVCGRWPERDGKTRIVVAYAATDPPRVRINDGSC